MNFGDIYFTTMDRGILAIIFVFIAFVSNWLFFIYAGFASKNKRLIYAALVYAIPFILTMLDQGDIAYKIWYIFWIVSFVHALKAKSEFLNRRNTIRKLKYMKKN
ncbi:hypothetical protein Ccar_07660 [Clostridium carboxidivorans P7]|uniref:hypothetical protein n=1 Tax=Clostridium carboxidivorans TaxID=217159 RepID=UPI0001D3930D|nr:hypothetical protein [Clostridium carboxidivorans]AKN30716.1 hypothetical protein Ccar_07660 [Clostridium carboxidivorans P7]EFG88582.1 hypothetical protein CLCAR_1804 [Clostridium carboxidivorans P7]